MNEIIELKSLLSAGNTKLPSTTAIFNLCSAHDCPSAKLGLCAAKKAGAKCYAIRAETAMRPAVLPYRQRQQKYWSQISADQFAERFISLNSTKIKPFTAIRFNESGDFHNQEELEKVERVAKILKSKGVVTYCYTSRSDLNYKDIKNLIIMGSGFMKEGISSEFRIIKKVQDRPKGYGLCVGNCRICNRCQKRGVKIAAVKH